jgi:hypothetical protein
MAGQHTNQPQVKGTGMDVTNVRLSVPIFFYKSSDPSNPCCKCWDKYAKPFTDAIAYAPFSSSHLHQTARPRRNSPNKFLTANHPKYRKHFLLILEPRSTMVVRASMLLSHNES